MTPWISSSSNRILYIYISSTVIVVCVPFLFLSLSNLEKLLISIINLTWTYDSLLSPINFSKMMMMTTKRKAIEMEMGIEVARLLAKADEGGTAPVGALQLRGGSMEGRRINLVLR